MTLLQNFDLLEYIEANLSYKTVPHSNEYRVCCVACGNINYKLYINVDKRQFNCFTCEFSSRTKDFFDLVALNEGISRPQAIQRFALTFKKTCPDFIELPEEEQEPVYAPTAIKSIKLPIGLKLVEKDSDGWKYLTSRGLTDNEITSCQVYYTNKDYWLKNLTGKVVGNLKDRVVFPVYGPPGLVSWQGRIIVPSTQIKYLSAPGSDLSKTLWPFVPPYGKTAIIVEGILDAIAVRRLPGFSSYASFGKKLSFDQIQVLKSWGVEELVVFFDKKDALPQIKSTVIECNKHFNKVTVPDYSDWPGNIDAGDCLLKGVDPIKVSLDTRIDSYSIEYTKFCLT